MIGGAGFGSSGKSVIRNNDIQLKRKRFPARRKKFVLKEDGAESEAMNEDELRALQKRLNVIKAQRRKRVFIAVLACLFSAFLSYRFLIPIFEKILTNHH